MIDTKNMPLSLMGENNSKNGALGTIQKYIHCYFKCRGLQRPVYGEGGDERGFIGPEVYETLLPAESEGEKVAERE